MTSNDFGSARGTPRHDLESSSAATVSAGPGPGPAPADLLRRLRARGAADPVTHVERVPARAGVPAPWPSWAPAELRAAFTGRGVAAPWQHQAEAANLAYEGQHVIVATGTASGKSLAYQLPALATVLADPRATVLYLAPTKALAADQLRAVAALELEGVRPACYDGDTPRTEREWIRRHSRFVLTNPDMLHHGILPGHAQWSGFLRRLAYVVIDECHTYRGVFGSHVAHVLRRLRRQCARFGATPVFVLASATSGDPATAAGRLTGLPVTAVTEDASPRGGVTFALWEPPLLPPDTSASSPVPPQATGEHDELHQVRRSALRETADLLADTVAEGVRTLAFVRSRKGAEVVAANARRALDDAVPGLGDRVAAYRGGYLREERRELERALLHGDLLGLASTNALELGVDLVGLDAVLICGYPGTRASLWQQAGRAGRSGQEALAVLVARDDPLDTYLVHHPEAIFGAPVEATVLDPANPYVLAPQLACAAVEAPLTPADLVLFGEGAKEAVDELVAAGALRQRPTGWYWRHRERPEVDLRGEGGAPVAVVESSTGRLLGTVDGGSSHFLLHSGAVYLHQGVSYVVDQLDLADGCALVRAEEPDWSTHARDVTDLSVVSVRSYVDAGPVGMFLGEVDVTSQVVSYQRRRIATGEVIDTRPLDLPTRELRTVAVWFTLSPQSLALAGVQPADVPGALHAAEHAAIGLLPLMATCDRWDIGGISTALHPDTEAPTVFVYDGHPGGAGFAERAYGTAAAWLRATRDAIAECGCDTGCPSCVQSPKCGNGNNPLSKPDAIRVLDVVLTNLPD
ncbi:putative ATP-dependent helicase YprA [Micromonospora noduli]|uniref:ATP-dependent helicase YprA n=2 Tax=Micromonospora noduli TaxID=709876 RepID=A0A328N5A7_9ACTN|nr:DEAD/DEAH box helicase [Micromonospora noduli]RAN98537.1 putative ATP-dependent helicase YprA [Micromonospora noduli]RAO20939.1 putative ATP-dependent helicase YprA [Micromonospora noduli]RAO21420.1 putative ATP-dependent helicase YprA [Micromonospora noduli]